MSPPFIIGWNESNHKLRVWLTNENLLFNPSKSLHFLESFTMTSKRDWHHQVEHERSSLTICLFFPYEYLFLILVPAEEIYKTDDGKTIRIEYREENGTIYKVFPTRLLLITNQNRLFLDDKNISKSKIKSFARRGRKKSKTTETGREDFSHCNCRSGKSSAEHRKILQASTRQRPKSTTKSIYISSPTDKSLHFN